MIDAKALKEKLEASLGEVEAARLELYEDHRRRQRIGYPIMGLGLVLAVIAIAITNEFVYGFVIGIVTVLGMQGWIAIPAQRFRKRYKQLLLPQIARQFGDFTYELQGGIPISTMRPSRIVPDPDRYSHEDYFQGTYEGVRIEFCEVHMERKVRTRKQTHYVTQFRGLTVMLDMNKPFEGHTIVRREWGAAKPFSLNFSMEKVKLEDPEFERMFKVHSTDQIEARVLLTPATMGRLKQLSDTVGAKGMDCAFFDNRLLILLAHDGAVRARNGLLEPGHISEPVHDDASIGRIAEEFASISGLVTELKLNETHRV